MALPPKVWLSLIRRKTVRRIYDKAEIFVRSNNLKTEVFENQIDINRY